MAGVILEKSKLEGLQISKLKDLYRNEFPEKYVLGRHLTKRYLISQLLNRYQEQYVEEVSVKSAPNNDVEDIKAHYKEEMGEEFFNEVDNALSVMPNLQRLSLSNWKYIKMHLWQEYNREMLFIHDSDHKSSNYRGDVEILQYLQDEDAKFFSKDISDFAKSYSTITWVFAYLGYDLAITAITSIVDDSRLLSVIYDLLENRSSRQ